MKKSLYRLGIIGTGRIAHRFVPEARTIDGIHVAAVYNPRLSSAQKFAEELKVEFSTDDIKTFLDKVDAVYIASPHETHVDYARKMIEAGKHVLCEKPMAFSAKEVEELFVLAEKNNLVLMEGLKTAYCPGFQALLEIVGSGKIGQVVDVEACFTKLVPETAREFTSETSAGSFYELGSYVLLPILKILGAAPKDVRFWNKCNGNGVDVYTKVYFDYGEATATGKVGLGVKSEGELIVSGTNGYVKVPAPWWLTKCIEVHYEDVSKTEVYDFPYEGQGLRYEIKEFVKRMESGIGTYLGEEESIWISDKMEMIKWTIANEKGRDVYESV